MVRHYLLGLGEAHDFMDVLLFSYTGMTNQWLNDHFCQRTVCKHSLPDYGLVGFVNRLVRTCMPGGVGAG